MISMQHVALRWTTRSRNTARSCSPKTGRSSPPPKAATERMLLTSQLGYVHQALGVVVGSGQQVGAGHGLDHAEVQWRGE